MSLIIEMLYKKPCTNQEHKLITKKVELSPKLRFILKPYIKGENVNIDLNNREKYLLSLLGIDDTFGSLECYNLNCKNKPCAKGYKIVYKVYLSQK